MCIHFLGTPSISWNAFPSRLWLDKFLIVLHDSMVNFASLSDSPIRLTQEGRHSFVLQLHFVNAFLIVLITLTIDLESFSCTLSLLVCEFLEDKNHVFSSPYPQQLYSSWHKASVQCIFVE